MLRIFYTKTEENQLAGLYEEYQEQPLHGLDEKKVLSLLEKIKKIEDKNTEKAMKYYAENIAELENDLVDEFLNLMKVAIALGIEITDLWLGQTIVKLQGFSDLLKEHDRKGYESYFARIREIYEHKGDVTPLCEKPSKFRLMKRNNVTDIFTRITSADKFAVQTKGIKKEDLTFERESTLLFIQEALKTAKIKNSTHKLLDCLMMKSTENAEEKKLVIRMTLKEYMDICGLKDEKTARKQVEEDLDSLAFFQIESHGKNEFAKIHIIGSHSLKKGVITVALDSAFAEIYQHDDFFAVISPEIFAINDKHNPNSYHLGRYIHVHKSKNLGKKSENVISVKNLLAACPNIPSVKEAESGNYKYREKIIKPFERDLNALSKIFSWHYRRGGFEGEILDEKTAEKLTISEFLELYIVIDWIYYPSSFLPKTREANNHRDLRKKSKKRKK